MINALFSKFIIFLNLKFFLIIDGPKELLKKVPGREPIAKPAKYIPAKIFPQNIIINILHNKFAKEIEKDE